MPHATASSTTKDAIFAGGCFWCMQPPFDKLPGVIETTVGYTGGETPSPTYEQVSSGDTAHAEAIKITYNPNQITYEKLLEVFWKNIDPTVKDRQFCDVGSQYRSAIFYANEAEKEAAITSKNSLSKQLNRLIYTEIVPAKTFYAAENYHQDYYKKNPIRYKFYRTTCGRDKRLKELWEQ